MDGLLGAGRPEAINNVVRGQLIEQLTTDKRYALERNASEENRDASQGK